jgi:hypothetical protein
MGSPSLETLLQTLAASDVELIVVGMLAAVAQGAPVTTHDLDIVHRRTPDNIARLLAVLGDLDARYRGHGEKVLRPTAETLSSLGHSLLQTRLGPGLDAGALGRINSRCRCSRRPCGVAVPRVDRVGRVSSECSRSGSPRAAAIWPGFRDKLAGVPARRTLTRWAGAQPIGCRSDKSA